VFPIVATGAAVEAFYIGAKRIPEVPVLFKFFPSIKRFGSFNDRPGLLRVEKAGFGALPQCGRKLYAA
jgi:hypothetical protein